MRVAFLSAFLESSYKEAVISDLSEHPSFVAGIDLSIIIIRNLSDGSSARASLISEIRPEIIHYLLQEDRGIIVFQLYSVSIELQDIFY